MPALLQNRSIVKITGKEASSFLQNLLTNDVSSLDKAIYAMILSPQGRFLFDAFVIKDNDAYLMDVFEGTKDLLLKRLNLYKINQDVSIESLLDLKIYYSQDEPKAGIYYKDPRYEKLAFRFISSENIDSDDSYNHDKYNYSIPDGGIDIIYDKAMPPEYGAEELNAISYSKGCYVGQEVISRTKYQGEVRKKIYRISSTESLENIEYGTEITSKGKKIGMVLSCKNNTGIGIIRQVDLEDNLTPQIGDKPLSISRACWY